MREGFVFAAANRSPRFIPRHCPRRDTDGQASGPSAIKAPRRTPATKALGEAVFKGTAGLSIPQNLELQSASGQRYRTSQSGVLSAQGTATITLKAVQGGVKGNASAGALLTLAEHRGRGEPHGKSGARRAGGGRTQRARRCPADAGAGANSWNALAQRAIITLGHWL